MSCHCMEKSCMKIFHNFNLSIHYEIYCPSGVVSHLYLSPSLAPNECTADFLLL